MANLTAIILLITIITAASAAPSPASPPATKYINHTVGGPTGWFFNSTSNTSFTNYSTWAASQTFNLGDYLSKLTSHLILQFNGLNLQFQSLICQFWSTHFPLSSSLNFPHLFFYIYLLIFFCYIYRIVVFNTENQTVIETQNITTYRSCSADDASDESTFVWGDDSVGVKKTIAVPLVTEGTYYYFSDAGDGQQCQQGMAFAIEVNHGLGLPPILAQPPPPPYMEPPSQSQPGIVDGTQPSGNGGFRSGASLAGGLFAFFALLILTV